MKTQLAASLAGVVLALALAGCGKEEPPAPTVPTPQTSGAQQDLKDAANATGDALSKTATQAKEASKDAANETGKVMEQAGKDLQNATK